MERLFSPHPFVDFGPCRLSPSAPTPAITLVQGARPSVLRSAVRQHCPRRPGVYGMLSAHGELIYVGKAKSLRTRLFSYFRPHSRDAKAGRIVRHTCALAWEGCPDEFAALHRELELIQRWRPRFNVAGQPYTRSRIYVCLGRRPAPYVFLTRQPPRDVLACFGPVFAGAKAREAVRRVNDWFRLRDCPQSQQMIFAEQGELFPMLHSAGCLRYELGTCLGPCAAACTRQDYGRGVRAARAFLAGTDLTPLQTLERDMQAAAESQAYERAAALRDRLEAMRWLHEQLDLMRRLRAEGSFVYSCLGVDSSETWYVIHEGRTVAALAAPLDTASRRAAEDRLRAIYRTGSVTARLESAEQRDGLLLVAAWFRRYPKQRNRTWTLEEALVRCR